MAEWLEHYADIMDLNVWTSSVVTSAYRDRNDDGTGTWSVSIKKPKTGEERVLRTNHVVFAIGVGGGEVRMPDLPGRVRDY